MKERNEGDTIPWWEVKGNVILRPLQPSLVEWGFKKIERYVLKYQPKHTKNQGGITGWYVFDRSFVLQKIKVFLIYPLMKRLSKEEILELVDEAFDFDLEEYKKNWYQSEENKV